LSQIESFASATGFRVQKHFFDRRRWFADSLWQSVQAGRAPTVGS